MKSLVESPCPHCGRKATARKTRKTLPLGEGLRSDWLRVLAEFGTVPLGTWYDPITRRYLSAAEAKARQLERRKREFAQAVAAAESSEEVQP